MYLFIEKLFIFLCLHPSKKLCLSATPAASKWNVNGLWYQSFAYAYFPTYPFTSVSLLRSNLTVSCSHPSPCSHLIGYATLVDPFPLVSQATVANRGAAYCWNKEVERRLLSHLIVRALILTATWQKTNNVSCLRANFTGHRRLQIDSWDVNCMHTHTSVH